MFDTKNDEFNIDIINEENTDDPLDYEDFKYLKIDDKTNIENLVMNPNPFLGFHNNDKISIENRVHTACKNKNLEHAVSLLQSYSFNINNEFKDKELCDLANKYFNHELVLFLIQKGATLEKLTNENTTRKELDDTALCEFACSNGKLDFFIYYYDDKIKDINIRFRNGLTPLECVLNHNPVNIPFITYILRLLLNEKNVLNNESRKQAWNYIQNYIPECELDNKSKLKIRYIQINETHDSISGSDMTHQLKNLTRVPYIISDNTICNYVENENFKHWFRNIMRTKEYDKLVISIRNVEDDKLFYVKNNNKDANQVTDEKFITLIKKLSEEYKSTVHTFTVYSVLDVKECLEDYICHEEETIRKKQNFSDPAKILLNSLNETIDSVFISTIKQCKLDKNQNSNVIEGIESKMTDDYIKRGDIAVQLAEELYKKDILSNIGHISNVNNDESYLWQMTHSTLFNFNPKKRSLEPVSDNNIKITKQSENSFR